MTDMDYKIYKSSYVGKIFLLCIFLLGIHTIYYYLKEGLYFRAGILFLLFIYGLYYFIKYCSEYIKIDNDKVAEVYKYLFFLKKTNEIRFDEIIAIQEDTASFLFLKFTLFYLIPKKGLKKPFRRFIIAGGISNRKDLISEILGRIDSNVLVEDAVYQYIGKGHSKTVTK